MTRDYAPSYAMLLLFAYRYGLRLSNELLFINIGQGAATLTCQSLRSEKIALLVTLLLSKKGFEWVKGQIFFGPPTLTGHSFSALDL